WHNLGYGALLAAFGVPLLGGLFAYSAERRNVLIFTLNQTRAELARVAVAEERLRISRDLHDLLGHSLSLIALKSELAGRVIESDPPRAAREIAELEAVARRSLAEVRQAVAGYRPPGPMGRPARPGPAWPGWRSGRPVSAVRCGPARASAAASGCGSASRSPRPSSTTLTGPWQRRTGIRQDHTRQARRAGRSRPPPPARARCPRE